MPPASDSVTPLVFLHAYPLDARQWRDQRERFAGRRVLTPNLPGFGGRSSVAPTLDDFADAVVADMDAAGVDRATVVGLSMGGYVAFRLWARYPHRVAALVLADTRAGADSPEGAARRTEQAERARREGIGWLAEAMLPNLLGETTRSGRPEVIRAVSRIIEEADPEGVARALLAMRERPDSTGLLGSIDVPVLALVGEEDTVTPPSEAHLIAERTPLGSLQVIPRAGHLSNLENPDDFNAAVAAFLGPR